MAAATLDLAAFVPPVVRELLAAGARASMQDCAERFEAALLFADAEGFSRMSAELIAQDTRGAEEIGAILNRHFSRIGAIVEATGGTLAAFAGDAISALWPVRRGDRRAAVLAAAMAGRAIRDTTPGAELSFRSAVDLGEAVLWHLGDGGRRRAVLTGPLFEALPALSQLSTRGGLTLTERAHAVAAGACRVRAVPGGVVVVGAVGAPPGMAPAAVPPPLAQAASFLPAPLVRVLAGAGMDWASELSLATVLFARLSAAQAGDEDAAGLRCALARAAAEVEALGGLPLQTVVDDKGLVLVAVWGLSFNRTEADAERALHAGRAIEAAARNGGLAAGVGIRTGRVFAGVVGGGLYRQYAVIGAAMNGAAWLMQQAVGGILVDAATRDAALARFRFTAAGTTAYKGGGPPEPVFAPEEARATPGETARGRLIGREAELARLQALLSAATPPLLWITGEAGIGKSHLARYARSIVAARGLDQIAAGADSLTRDRPYAAMARTFMHLLGLAAEDDPATQAAALARAVPEPKLFMPIAAALGLAQAPAPVAASEQARQAQRMREALLDVLESRIDGRPLVLHVEDAHWLDTASWQLLAAARVRLPRLGLVLVARPVDPLALPAEARALHDGAEHVALGPLAPEAAAALVADAIGAVSVPAPLARRVHARAEGHPYYTRELAAALLRSGAVRVEGGICHIAMGAEALDAAFPDTIGAAIATRFAGLDPAAQLTLRVASVEGREFSAADVAAVRPRTDGHDGVEAHLAAAQGLGLIEPDPRRPGGLRFYHALAREAIYDLLTEAQRRQLHAAVAARQEVEGSGADPDRHALLAHHWAAAGENARAVFYLDSAAARAESAGSHVEVVNLLRRAQRLAPSGSKPAAAGQDWDDRIGRALFHLGNVRGSIEHMERAVAPVTGPLPRGAAIVPRLLGEFARIRLNRPGPPAPPGEHERILAAADACLRLSYQHYEVQDLPAAMLACFLTVNLGRRAGGANVPLALGLASLAVASLSAPFLLDGHRYRELAVAMAEELAAPDGLFWIGIGASTFDLVQGRFAEAERLVDRAIAVAREQMGARDWEMAVSHKANLMRTMGRHREGSELDGLTLASSRDRGLVLGRIWGLTGRCKSLYWTGEIDAFRAELAELKALIADVDIAANTSRNNALSAAAAEANLALLEGDTTRALERIGTVVRLFAGVRDPQYYMEDVPGYVADALLRAWQIDHSAPVVPVARANVRAARRIARLYPVARGRVALARGDLALFSGRPDRARARWAEARDYAASRGLGAAEAQVLVRDAMPELRDGSARQEAAARVDAIFSGLGAETPFHWRQIMDGA